MEDVCIIRRTHFKHHRHARRCHQGGFNALFYRNVNVFSYLCRETPMFQHLNSYKPIKYRQP